MFNRLQQFLNRFKKEKDVTLLDSMKNKEFFFTSLAKEPSLESLETKDFTITFSDFNKTFKGNEGFYYDSHTILLPVSDNYFYVVLVNPEDETDISIPLPVSSNNPKMSLENTLNELREKHKWQPKI